MPPLVIDVILIAGGIAVLYFGAEWLVHGAARLARSLGVSPIVVGLTVVSFGTSAPELVVCVVAATGGNPELAIGNVMGSNLANIGLILGVTAIFRPLFVHARVVSREVPIMILVSMALYPLVWEDLELGRGDGILLLLALVGYLVFVSQTIEDETPEILGEYEEFVKETVPNGRVAWLRDFALIAAGSGLLVIGGYAIVEGAVSIAQRLGIGEIVIGLTVVAIGTSLPELATSLVAAMRQESDIAVGNVIGSNIFNIAAILGTASVLAPIGMSRSILMAEIVAVVVVSILLFALLRLGNGIGRREGIVLFASYLIATFLLL